jgi:hypothetical protein
MSETNIPARIPTEYRALASARFYALAEVPPNFEWFKNIQNEWTRAAYRLDIQDFMGFIGGERPEDFHLVTRAHVIDCVMTSSAGLSPGDHLPQALGAVLTLSVSS